MSLAREALGVVLWMMFGGLGLFGAGLVVEVAELALDWKRNLPSDAIRQRAGRWSQLRRYAICWLCTAVLWAATVLFLVRDQ